ncbi:MAG: hypothetical protein JWQ81_8715 [Amycolatopsis sp.]|nr:hypothetical protein [Amycolatopsis sp.]
MKVSFRSAGVWVIAATAALVLPSAVVSPEATASAGPADPQAVIVVLRDQLAGLPVNKTASAVRRRTADSAQNAVLGGLTGAAPKDVKHFSLGNAFSATVTAAQAAELAANPGVAEVLPDRKLMAPVPVTPKPQIAPAPSSTQHGPSTGGNAPGAICPSDPAKPLLEPEALSTIHAASTDGSPSAAQLATGAGVKVAVIEDTLDPNAPDFIRPDGSKVFTDYQDFTGDGINSVGFGGEGFGDSSAIAAQGTVVHDLSKFVNPVHPLPDGCNIAIKGVAPGVSLVGLTVYGAKASDSSALAALDYAVNVDHVDVINESAGEAEIPDFGTRDLLRSFNEQAVAAGVSVVVSSGDAGASSTIQSPGSGPSVILVGASTDGRVYQQTGIAATALSNGKWLNNNVSSLSSGGITQDGHTLDLVAPGEEDWSTCAPGYGDCLDLHSPPRPSDVFEFGGTSQSAPFTAGAAALVIQAYRNAHGGSTPAPALVKSLLTSTAQDLGLPADEQGSGLLDARAAVEAATTAPGATGTAPAGTTSNIALSTDQISLDGAPGRTQTATVRVTDVGARPLTVSTGTRTFVPQFSQTHHLAFDSTALPTFLNFAGVPQSFLKVPIAVPPGADRLAARIAWQGTVNPTVKLTMLAPDGTYVADSFPQGGAVSPNYGNLDVRQPVAGTWTAIVYSKAGAGSFTGAVDLDASTQRAVPVPGSKVGPQALHLAPGQSEPVMIALPTPSSSGDQAYSVTFAGSDGHQTAVSAVVRTLIPTDRGIGYFSGTITGGNARPAAPAQTFTYGFDVPGGKKDLDVGLTRLDPADVVRLALVDPNGELADMTDNAAPSGHGLVQGDAAQLVTANPQRGRWEMVVAVENPVSGKELESPFTGTVRFDQAGVSASGLPTASGTTIRPGSPLRVPVTVHNTGVEAIAVGVDPRTDSVETLHPVPFSGSSAVTLPQTFDAAQVPIFRVPPDTSSFSVTGSATVPIITSIQGDTSGLDQGGDLKGAQNGSTVSVATVSEQHGYVGIGAEVALAQEVGPFGPNGAAAGNVNFTSSVQTAGFDRSVTSSTGDPFAGPFEPDAPATAPAVIQPGGTATIMVTFTPYTATNTVVTGHLNLVTVPEQPSGLAWFSTPGLSSGEVLANLSYSYRVG